MCKKMWLLAIFLGTAIENLPMNAQYEPIQDRQEQVRCMRKRRAVVKIVGGVIALSVVFGCFSHFSSRGGASEVTIPLVAVWAGASVAWCILQGAACCLAECFPEFEECHEGDRV